MLVARDRARLNSSVERSWKKCLHGAGGQRMEESWEQPHSTRIRSEKVRLNGGKEGNRSEISAGTEETGFVQSGEEEAQGTPHFSPWQEGVVRLLCRVSSERSRGNSLKVQQGRSRVGI